MARLALSMLLHRKMRSLATVLGGGAAFFLVAAQIGLLVGWCSTNSAIVLNADADIWVMARQTPAFDYGAAIPKSRIHQARSVPGVVRADGMFMSWSLWQRTDGKMAIVEVIGIDEGGVGGPWAMRSGGVEAVFRPDHVIVDELYLDDLGVTGVGQEFEMMGNRAVVGGISRGVRTFTAAPYIFTSLKTAVKFDRRYRDDDIMYVLVKCSDGADPARVRESIERALPQVEALTSREFAARTVRYWMLGTGAGVTVVVTAAMGLLVGGFIMSQTLSAITFDHLPNYATLIALGFSEARLSGVILIQSAMLCGGGVIVGTSLFALAGRASSRTPLPLETTPVIFTCIVAASFITCVMASFASIRCVFRVDPISVFRV